MLACPIDKQALLYLDEEGVLYNPRLRRLYQVRDGIPVMLADQGETVSEDRHRELLSQAAAAAAHAPPWTCTCTMRSARTCPSSRSSRSRRATRLWSAPTGTRRTGRRPVPARMRRRKAMS